MSLVNQSRSASPKATETKRTTLFGHLSPTKDELKTYVKGYKERFDQYQIEVEERQKKVEKMNVTYLQELNNLRMQLHVFKDDRKKKPEYLEVRYFEPTEIISKDMCTILNSKIKELKSLYEK